MTDTPSPTPEEIEAAARAIRVFMQGWDSGNWEGLHDGQKIYYLTAAEAALQAAMAVRRGK